MISVSVSMMSDSKAYLRSTGKHGCAEACKYPCMATFGERLGEAMKLRGVTATQIAHQLPQATRQAVGDVLNGKSKSFRADNALAAARVLGVSPRWLIDGLGKPSDPPDSGANLDAIGLPYAQSRGARMVPVVGTTQGGLPERLWDDAGLPVGVSDEFAEVATSDPHAFLVRVVGDSMSPRYLPGEFALVEPKQTVEVENDVLLRLVDGRTMLKRLLSRRDGYHRFGSWNPEHPPFTVQEAEIEWMYYVANPIPARNIKSRL